MGKLIAVQGCLIQSKTAGVTVANFQITTPPVNTVLADKKPVYAGTLSVVATGITMGNFTCPTATFTIVPQKLFATIDNQFILLEGDSGLCTCLGTAPNGATASIVFTCEISQAGQTSVELDISEGQGDLSGIIKIVNDLNRDVIQLTSDLNNTKNELISTKAELDLTKQELTSTKAELDKIKNSIPTETDIQNFINNMDIINSNLNGDIITSNRGGSDRSGHFIVIPQVLYHLIDPTHTTSTYMKELLKWICTNYPNHKDTLMVTLANPNAKGFALIQIYDTNKVNGEGLPEYSTITYIGIGGVLLMFGTYNYSFFEKSFISNNENFQGNVNA